jgi:cytoskeletal protein RodZ
VSDHFDDPRDEALARGLGALAPSEFDFDADRTLGSMRPALQRARARRRLAVSTSVLGAIVVLGAGAVVVQDQSQSHVKIEGPTQTSVSTPGTNRTTTSPRVTTTTPSSPTPTPTTTPAAHTGTTRNVSGVVGGTPGTTPSSTPNSGSTPGDQGGGRRGDNKSTTTLAAPSTRTYSSPGGRTAIRFANGTLTLVSYTASAGYMPEVQTNKPDDIEVRFSSDTADWRIRVRVQDGRVQSEIKEH